MIALAACSGGGGTSPTPMMPGNATGGGSAPTGAGRTSITFTMHWTSPAPASAFKKRPAYVPATARSVSVSVNGGTPQVLNSPATTLTIAANPGVDTFAFEVFDEQNGEGNVLSQAQITQTMVAGTANVVTATLNGVINAVQISLSNPKPDAGVAATVNVNVAALDADNNVIVGASDYSTPIKLAISDPTNSGTLSLSASVLQNPAAAPTLTYTGGTLNSGLAGGPVATVVASASGVATVSVAFTPTPTFYQFSIPVTTNRPQYIAAGSDGNMWFTESPGNAVARITPAGVVTEFTVPTANSNPQQIIGASDGNLWFTEFSSNKITRVTTTGGFTEFGTLFGGSDNPLGLVDRGDGNIWYTANGGNHIGFQGITSGVAGETTVPTASSSPFGIATAPDNNLYFTENATDKIGRIANLFSTIMEIPLTPGTAAEEIVRGPDGNVWFTENGTNQIGRLSPSSFSVTAEFPTLTPNSEPVGITAGADGALWFTESGLDKIGRVTTGGTMMEFPSPVAGLGLKGIALAPDGSLWFDEPGSGLSPGRIGKLVY